MKHVPHAIAGVLLVILAACVAVWPAFARQMADQKETLSFRGKPATVYPARDAHDQLTIAAEPYDGRDEVREAFGKNDPNSKGILPLLIVITNGGQRAVRLDKLKVEFITRDRQKLLPMRPNDVAIRMRKKVNVSQMGPRSPIPGLPGVFTGGGDQGIDALVNAFEVRMVVPEATAAGFFYFDVGAHMPSSLSGSKLFLNGMNWADDGKELMYFEVDLDKALAGAPAPATGK